MYIGILYPQVIENLFTLLREFHLKALVMPVRQLIEVLTALVSLS